MRGPREMRPGSGLVRELMGVLVLALFIPLGLGILLDRILQTSPLMTLFVLALGITGGTVAVSRAVAKEYRRVEGDKQ